MTEVRKRRELLWLVFTSYCFQKPLVIRKICISAKFYNPGAALAGFQTTWPCLQQVEPAVQLKPST